jgi:phenylalanyl-tRNA synthetase beta chain
MQEFAPIAGQPDEIADQLTALGLVVESIETVGADWEGIIVARVLTLRPHPKADKIQLVDVDTGDGEPLQICCGAFNIGAGDLVPMATLGTVMANGMEIARRKLRGEWSNGMLCSAQELESGDDADGILILDTEASPGTPLAEALGARTDIVFDIDVEGNRPDALSIGGIARDLAARQGAEFTVPVPEFAESGVATRHLCSITIDDAELCPRFGLRVLRNVRNGQSPAWMQHRLQAAGMRPINTIVDISNYVMIETGHPNHTFDLDTIPDGALTVRRARMGERLTTLDDTERELLAPDGSGIGRGLGDGVITNADGTPLSLAGVMGGRATEIGDSTTTVLLEAAVWHQMSIAHTSRRLNLRSEASTRFERGVDPHGLEHALDRFCELAVELAGAEIAPGTMISEPVPLHPVVVTTRTARINQLLGTDLDASTMIGYLRPIGFGCTEPEDGADRIERFEVTVPTWRPDTTIEADIAEEVGRHHGYDRIDNRVPVSVHTGELSDHQRGRRRIRRAFAAAGCAEALPLPFLAPGDLAAAGLEGESLVLANPLVAEESVLRTSLLPGLLKAVAYNHSHRRTDVRLFELGSVYLPRDAHDLPDEPEQVAAILGDADAAVAVSVLKQISGTLGIDVQIRNGPRPGLHPRRSADVVFRGRSLGEVGEVDPGVVEAFGISGRVGWIRMDVDPLIVGLSAVARAKPVSRFPTSDIDLAFIVPDSIEAAVVRTSLLSAGRPLVRSVELFDVFRSEQLGDRVRSLAFALELQADDRTLSDDDVASVRQRMIDEVEKRHEARLR